MQLIPPGTVSEHELARLFASERFHTLTAGAAHIHTVNAAPDAHPIIVPAVYALIRPRASEQLRRNGPEANQEALDAKQTTP